MDEQDFATATAPPAHILSSFSGMRPIDEAVSAATAVLRESGLLPRENDPEGVTELVVGDMLMAAWRANSERLSK